jgi:transcriptional regulator with XRE-family HTH domain
MCHMPDAVRGIAYPLYQRVERERALRGWSATRLRNETGVSRSTVAKWATQQQPPQPGTVNAVADALGIDRAEALRLAGILTDAPAPVPAGTQLTRDDLDRMERRLGVDLSKVDRALRDTVLSLCYAVIDAAGVDLGKRDRSA